ncbi:Methoxyneurosporene dehydrogenase [Caenispirillum salinarum AK4]|uniref:Methoxyneurosporene dehydrogenase n=1 Tax=Caenispirillum salinarum AK4 TaxID=1238182 RepID=K9H3I8_9PROT|nr:1-hydroxycarotenoid 3,4-desaturase CrtD [Caenispirillum salinarum]EKV32845.1 Methoxyneurosporene dehydrogenase [Caenispirillum salinarum AK4]
MSISREVFAAVDRRAHVAVIGAGVAGLTAAVDLARRGFAVTVLERGPTPGGKMRTVDVAGRAIDAGPTVLTLPDVLEDLFADAGARLADHLTLEGADILARHAWPDDGGRFDLPADPDAAVAAVEAFAGAAEARRFARFLKDARRIYQTLDQPFMRSERPSVGGLVKRAGALNLAGIKPFATLWKALGDYFHDPRLRQLFGRYATYTGSNPYLAPATLMLIAHVEQAGVWVPQGGMAAVARALAGLAESLGVAFLYSADVSAILTGRQGVEGVRLADGATIAAESVVCNADVAALSTGLFGTAPAAAVPATRPADRSLSALTLALVAEAEGFPLSHHTVFFSGDYRAEFDAIARGRLPPEPTVYVCAQDRGAAADSPAPQGVERLFLIVNAPATADTHPLSEQEIARCEETTFTLMARCGLTLKTAPTDMVRTGPAEFAGLFPATGGALYGRASHGWTASFDRPGARTRLPGLYLAGGSVHPGAGVPMAALSGRLAAACLAKDRASMQP